MTKPSYIQDCTRLFSKEWRIIKRTFYAHSLNSNLKDNFDELPNQVYDADVKDVEPSDRSGKTEGDTRFLQEYVSEARDIDMIRRERKKDLVCDLNIDVQMSFLSSLFSLKIVIPCSLPILWSMYLM